MLCKCKKEMVYLEKVCTSINITYVCSYCGLLANQGIYFDYVVFSGKKRGL